MIACDLYKAVPFFVVFAQVFAFTPTDLPTECSRKQQQKIECDPQYVSLPVVIAVPAVVKQVIGYHSC